MKQKVIIGLVLLLLVGGYFMWTKDNFQGGGVALNTPTFLVAATSGAMTITGDVQILATSSRAYAIICNDSANVVYLSIDGDKPASNLKGLRLNAAGGCYEINKNNLYQGAVRATSTVSSSLIITEFKAR